ncbi:MAG: YbaB/EbfC family nucleoid-associated protein [Candidatus Eremiobacteraeota bacterium]|nr:YbaB/EbfC family nucleoid-associated protein [Candidatus Eremiobacteraeota bacterium]MBV8654393.1 YbaB/EbfC family nucleoid-associated protein [Candidatus Eremiobacteraeota bacterium]
MNQAQLMQQMRKMQQEMQKAQEELSNTIVTGVAAGETVRIEMTADYQVKGVKLSRDAVDPDDLETLEDLVLVAFNDAVKKAQDASAKRMGALTGGMRIPGL